MKRWVCGFLFNHQHDMVALIAKKHGPEIVVGKLNGIGGKIEDGEIPLQAMVREFREEAGVVVSAWEPFCDLRVQASVDRPPYGIVHFFKASATPFQFSNVKTQEDEEIMWVQHTKLRLYNVVPNLHWLVPLALAKNLINADVFEEVP